MAIGRQLNRMLKAKNITVAKLIAETGIPAGTIYSIRKKDSQATNMHALTTLAEYLNVPVGYFFRDDILPEDWETGAPRPVEPNTEYRMPMSSAVRDETLSLIGALSSSYIAVRLTDDSMEPLYMEGDTVLVDRSRHCVPSQSGLFECSGNVLCRTLGDGFLLPANPSFPPVPTEPDCECIGIAVGALFAGPRRERTKDVG